MQGVNSSLGGTSIPHSPRILDATPTTSGLESSEGDDFRGMSETQSGRMSGGLSWGVNGEDPSPVARQHFMKNAQGLHAKAAAAGLASVDNSVAVEALANQVESSSITTRNGAIQREMQDAYRKLIRANVERKLTLQDVASFSTFLVGVRVRLHEKGSNLRRRHSVLSSLIKHAPRARVHRIYSDLATVEEQESALSKDVDLFNKLQQDLKESPAYKAMMEYGQSAGMVNVDGTMMPDPRKHPELEAMASMSVKDMLAEFRMEDKRNEATGQRHIQGEASSQPGAMSGQKGKKGKKRKKDRRR